ncbi:MAG: FtsQ-type POTRA domain-containing protein [Propionibacteriaceae bacterium]|nr:FtsQ-type POTRA domain-containing protein [Propionibacteriaceae bacterium]
MSTVLPPPPVTLSLKREQARRRRNRRRWAIVSVVVPVVGFAVWAIGFSPWLAADRVDVTGASTIDVTSVVSVAEVPLGEPLIRIDPDVIASRVETLPVVADAVVSRHLDGVVLISVTERVPSYVLVTVEGALTLVDTTGTPYLTVSAVPEGLIPVTLTESAEHSVGLDRLLSGVVSLVDGLSDDLRAQITGVTAASADDLTLVLATGARVAWGGPEQSELKAEVLTALMRTVQAPFYDVSAPSHPASRQDPEPAG